MPLRCLEIEKYKKALTKVHDGIYGAHSNGLVVSQKFLRAGYYWLTMQANVI